MLRFTWNTQASVMLSQVLHPGNLFYIVVNLTTGREIVSADNLAEEVNLQTYLFYLYEYLSVSLFSTGIDQNFASVWHQLCLGQDFASAGFEVCL